MSRSKRSQSKHDAHVRKIARRLERQGYDVQADVTGFPQPNAIGGYRPDVIAKKPGERKVIEVETPDSVGSARDEGQRKAFRQAADRSNKTMFRREVTD